ncbi:class I SAM-dependent RNA methyltransferase [Leptospira ilyithenensis]|uniref:Class I SAM-dependent RNA methyltransferase n=1 Tax=Leptospira ilyithenensis TaxID=2484901 RepID=A0A4R9LPE7_9LEPT|nr:methyltransferase domain-containing protein [Leptospira ilyithenensis]TGN10955.1 class I SAM-dependent RNA methyltransferase [Leptospira ilyithenensis]
MKKIRLKLEKWAHGGYTLSHHEGHPVFVTGGIPGEEVELEIEKDGKKEWFGRVMEVHEFSPQRIKIDCEAFGECGGCSYRHISYEKELELKLTLLKELFPNFKKQISLISGSPSHYRNNVQWQIVDGNPGFYERFSHDLVESSAKECMNLDPKLQWKNLSNEIKKPKQNINPKSKSNSIQARISLDKVVPYEKENTLFLIKGKTIYAPPNGFFQINQFLIEPWIDRIGSWLSNSEKVLELFCGSGSIGICLNDKIESLLGYESHPKSIQFAKKNASKNGIDHYLYEVKDLYTQKMEPAPKGYPTWIINPPRAGLNPLLLEQMERYKPKKLIYSSCNASTLRRDAIGLEKIGYEIKEIVLVDFFPRTAHYEVLTLFESVQR